MFVCGIDMSEVGGAGSVVYRWYEIMSDRVSWSVYKSKKILNADFSNLAESEKAIEVIMEAKTEVMKSSEVLVFFNTEGSVGTLSVVEEFKKFLNETKSHIKKSAVCNLFIYDQTEKYGIFKITTITEEIII
jgi:hypothetical protein